MSRSVTLFGASVRAAAQSAVRGGWSPWSADLFVDQDLARLGPARRIDDYPQALRAILDEAPAGPWMYTGGLENDPELLDELARRRPLAGNAGAALRGVRDPQRLAAALGEAGLPFAEVQRSPRGLPRDGSWLCKPLRSAGGRQIAPLTVVHFAEDAVDGNATADFYFQRRLPGPAFSGLYLAAHGDCRLLGVTQQWVGTPWLHAQPYHYAGSLGPWPLTAAERAPWEAIGATLTANFSLQGLFGVDAILVSGVPVPVEVNPRYTASAEVLERAAGVSFVALHLAACLEGRLPDPRDLPSADEVPCFHGKAILFAPHDGQPTSLFFDVALQDSLHQPDPQAADIPAADFPLLAHWPVLSLFAQGPTPDKVEASLIARAKVYEQRLPARRR